MDEHRGAVERADGRARRRASSSSGAAVIDERRDDGAGAQARERQRGDERGLGRGVEAERRAVDDEVGARERVGDWRATARVGRPAARRRARRPRRRRRRRCAGRARPRARRRRRRGARAWPGKAKPAAASASAKPGASVLWPMTRSPTSCRQLTAPIARASGASSSHSASAASLCGMVTLAPSAPVARRVATASRSAVGRHGERDEHGVDAGRGERGVEHRGAARVLDRPADHGGELRAAGDHGVPRELGAVAARLLERARRVLHQLREAELLAGLRAGDRADDARRERPAARGHRIAGRHGGDHAARELAAPARSVYGSSTRKRS